MRIILLALALIVPASALMAQVRGVEKNPIPRYSLNISFSKGTVYHYTLKEKTKVVRQYRDSVFKRYEREVTYFFALSRTGEKDGMTEVTVNIDSMRYRLKDADLGKELYYDSQDRTVSTVKDNYADLLQRMAPMNHGFRLLYSPYHDVSEVTGMDQDGDIMWLRNYVTMERENPLDTAERFTWMDGCSDEQLKYIADIPKALINGRMQIGADSTWNRAMRLRLDGIDFIDSVKARVVSQSKGWLTLSLESTALVPDRSKDARFFGIPALCTITGGSGKSKVSYEMTQQGVVRNIVGTYKARVEGQYKREKFVQDIESELQWNMAAALRWE